MHLGEQAPRKKSPPGALSFLETTYCIYLGRNNGDILDLAVSHAKVSVLGGKMKCIRHVDNGNFSSDEGGCFTGNMPLSFLTRIDFLLQYSTSYSFSEDAYRSGIYDWSASLNGSWKNPFNWQGGR